MITFRADTKGFTLIELLIVIAIIGILSSVVLASLNSARQKAQISKMKQEVAQIVKVVEMAKIEGYTTLISMTGSGCSYCGGPAATAAALAVIAQRAKATDSGIERISTDPWGGLYALDENEGEQAGNPCARDILVSSKGHVYKFEYGSAYCLANPVGVAGWQ